MDGRFELVRVNDRIECRTAEGVQDGWIACRVADCTGDGLAANLALCFEHANKMERDREDWAECAIGRGHSLAGLEVSPDLWKNFLRLLTRRRDIDGTLPGFTAQASTWNFDFFMYEEKFSGYVDFTFATFRRGFRFSGCRFNLDLTFRHALMVRLSLNEVHVERGLWLQDLEVTKDSGVYVDEGTFGSLRGARFKGNLRISKSTVRNEVQLAWAECSQFWLIESSVAGGVDFWRAAFGEFLASRTHFQGEFKGELHVRGYCNLQRAIFDRRCALSISAPKVDLQDAKFSAGGTLLTSGATLGLAGLVSDQDLLVNGQGTSSVASLDYTDLSRVTLRKVDLRHCRLQDAFGLATVDLDSVTYLNAPRLRSRRRVLWDEYLWRQDQSVEWMTWVKAAWPVVQSGESRPGQVSAAYRALRVSLEKRSNEPGAADFYYGEMEMRRHDKVGTSWPERCLLHLYWLVSGYGLRATRSVATLLVVAVGATYLLQGHGLKDTAEADSVAALTAAQSLLPGIRVTTELTSTGHWMSLVLRVLGPVLIGLSALALRNRVKR